MYQNLYRRMVIVASSEKKRYALGGLILAVGLVLYAMGNSDSYENKKTSRQPSVLRCNGYDIVLPEQDFVPVQMHEPSITEALAVENESDIPELKYDLATAGNDVGFEPQIYSPPPMTDPRTVRASRGRRDASSFLKSKSPFSDNILGEENLPSWGWLADGTFAEEEAAKKAGESKRSADMNKLWGREYWKHDNFSLFGTKTPAGGSKEPLGDLLKTREKESRYRGSEEQKRLSVFGEYKFSKDTSKGPAFKEW